MKSIDEKFKKWEQEHWAIYNASAIENNVDFIYKEIFAAGYKAAEEECKIIIEACKLNDRLAKSQANLFAMNGNAASEKIWELEKKLEKAVYFIELAANNIHDEGEESSYSDKAREFLKSLEDEK